MWLIALGITGAGFLPAFVQPTERRKLKLVRFPCGTVNYFGVGHIVGLKIV